ncbi:MAG: alpha-2-macroglobulin [Caulobacterales bacterium]
MKLDLNALRERAAALGARIGKTVNWTENRNAVLAASVALMVGLWGGAVLAKVGGGGAPLDVVASGGALAGGEVIRAANAPRARAGQVDGMAWINTRLDMSGANPRACLEFSRPLSQEANVNLRDYINIEPAAPFQTEASGSLLCIAGLPFEPDRQVTIKQGLPASNGERTRQDETFTLSFGDRPAYVGFSGNGVILPRAEADGLAIETVNVSKLDIEVLRVPDRILSQRSIDPGQSYDEGSWGWWGEGDDVGVKVFTGEIDIALGSCPDRPNDRGCNRRNQGITTVFPLGAHLNDMRPGAYIVRVKDDSPGAGANGRDNDRPAFAYRWIIYTDTALQTFEGATGMDVVARSLRTARPLSNVTLTLIAENNEELARARTNSDGLVHFNKALFDGEGPARARYVMAYGAGGDFAALDLNRSALDLSDRNVDGRRTPGDIDAYIYTERGVYRPGERARIIGLIRDPAGRAITNRESTLVVYRPNGTEARRIRMRPAVMGGAVAQNFQLDRSAPRGMWRADLLVDGQDDPAGSVSFSVEDFVPQRLRVRMTANEAALVRGQSRPIAVQADFLYGAPGGGLNVEAEARLTVDPNPFPEARGYLFGKTDESFSEQLIQLPATTTDGSGAAQLLFNLQTPPETSLPLRARVVASVADPGGRVVREGFTIPVRLSDFYLGVKPRFENQSIAHGAAASFDVIALNAQGQRANLRSVSWRLVEEDWHYDWYLDGGQWKWRRTGRDLPIDGGVIEASTARAATIAKGGLRDGQYRLIVSNEAAGAETTYRFNVGWSWDGGDNASPDMVTVDPPRDPVRPGARARVNIRPPYAGEVQIVVATDRVLMTRTMRVGAEGANVDLPVTEEWGAGAYVLVTVMTPRDPVNLPVPRRAVGVAYVPVNVANRTLAVEVGEGMGVVRPRQRLNVPIHVTNVPSGERVRVAIAAVDQGILGLTNYQSPNPVDYFFGRRALGVWVRDDYGRLLNPNLGAPATARQGGDSLGGEGLTVVPTKTVSLFSDVVELDRSGRAVIPLDIPDFNGELRLMAVAWTESAVGQDAEALTVRDPVVAELILPRFLAPGDEASAILNIDNVEGPAGAYRVAFSGSSAAVLNAPEARVQLGRGQRQTVRVPIRGGNAGVGQVSLRLTGPGGFTPIARSYDIQSRSPFMPITLVETAPQNAGASWRAPGDALSRFAAGESQALISYSNLANMDPAPLIDSLERYPYGCSEQLTSVSMPLLYFNTLAKESGRTQDARLRRRIQDAVTRLLDRQGPDGAFGLWSAGDGHATPWLGAYVTDFLTRAKAQGYMVPQAALDKAYDALRRVARLEDYASVGYDFAVYRWPGSNDTDALLRSRSGAYALYVLAKAGRADISQVRYFHDARLRDEPSPLARAQIAAALAHLGDRARARNAFRLAEEALGYRNTGDWYQTPVRDLAGVLALAAEAGQVELVDRIRRRIEREAPDPDNMMTQEQAQMLMAANALLERSGPLHVSLNGRADAGRRVMANAAQLAQGLVFRNDGQGVAWRSLTLSGAPREAPGAMSAGYSINKAVYSLTGERIALDSVRQGDRVIVVVNGAPEGVRLYPTVVVDLLPAGLEIESVLTPEDGLGPQQYDGTRRSGPFAWVGEISSPRVAEARDDRFVSAIDLRGSGFTFAYMARAVTPGAYTLPGAQVEDMYRPGVMARTDSGRIRIAPAG